MPFFTALLWYKTSTLSSYFHIWTVMRYDGTRMETKKKVQEKKSNHMIHVVKNVSLHRMTFLMIRKTTMKCLLQLTSNWWQTRLWEMHQTLLLQKWRVPNHIRPNLLSERLHNRAEAAAKTRQKQKPVPLSCRRAERSKPKMKKKDRFSRPTMAEFDPNQSLRRRCLNVNLRSNSSSCLHGICDWTIYIDINDSSISKAFLRRLLRSRCFITSF